MIRKSIFFIMMYQTLCSIDNLVSVKDLVRHNRATYQLIEDTTSFSFQRLQLSLGDDIQPYQGAWEPIFIATIPHGRVHSLNGWVTIDNCYIKELIWRNNLDYLNGVARVSESQLRKVSGRVVVLAQMVAHSNYYHFLYEVLGRLSVIESQGIKYDWLYVPCNKAWIKELLQLWGVDFSKIIQPMGDGYYIEADELIIPSFLVNTCFEKEPDFGGYLRPNIIVTIRNKLVNAANNIESSQIYAKKIFISRKDASIRRVTNEDEVFEFFKAKGFVRYEPGKLSVVEQIKLFAQAEIVVAVHGASSINMIFCKQGTKYIELFQALRDGTFSFLAQTMHMNYTAVQTAEFLTNHSPTVHDHAAMPLFIVKSVADTLCK